MPRMSNPDHVAVIDVGKTNAKLALVDARTLREIAVKTRPNTVLRTEPWPHFDLDGHWAFFLETLRDFHAVHGIDAISVTTHGASAVLLDDKGELAAPMLDYEHDGPDSVRADYEKIRPPFAQTGSPALPMGLNLGAQLFWQFKTHPDLKDRTAHILTYPQYWGYRLTGEMATDVTSLGCHTDLWQPFENRFSDLVARMEIADRLAAPKRPFDILGPISSAVAKETGLSPETPVTCGIHDSNASLLPYLKGRQAPFAVVSTGTWVIAMAVGGDPVVPDPARDTLVNVNAFGDPVPSARFMGGREFEIMRGKGAAPTDADRQAVLDGGLMLLPAVEPGSGPFQGRTASWAHEPETGGQLTVALSYYLAMMTNTCLDLAGARGPVIVEGPFAANADYCAMLAVQRREGVHVAGSATGTSIGSALLALTDARSPETRPVQTGNIDALRHYARQWQDLTCA